MALRFVARAVERWGDGERVEFWRVEVDVGRLGGFVPALGQTVRGLALVVVDGLGRVGRVVGGGGGVGAGGDGEVVGEVDGGGALGGWGGGGQVVGVEVCQVFSVVVIVGMAVSGQVQNDGLVGGGGERGAVLGECWQWLGS